jgi:hypothetical protein
MEAYMKNAYETYAQIDADDSAAREAYFESCASMMDDEIREMLHSHMAPCSKSAFLEAYCDEHYNRFSQEFIVM